MMGENPNYWWSLNGKLPLPLPPSAQQAYPTYNFSPPPLQPVAPLPPALLNPPPYLFGSSLLVPAAANSSNFAHDHHHHDNQDFPVSWSQLLLSGLASEEEQTLNPSSIRLGATHVGEAKHDSSFHQQSRQISYSNRDEHGNNNNNDDEEDERFQACSSSWSSQLNPIPSIGSSSTTSLSTNTSIFDFSSKIEGRNQHTNRYSSQCDETSTSGASKKHRFQPSSTQPSSVACNDTLTSGTSKKARVQHASTQPPLKVRKEKLGDRISALHQLVSPFGKTDTASVLLEATVHIRFLEGQIEALSSPYMNLGSNVSGNTRHQHSVKNDERNCLILDQEPGQFLNDDHYMKRREASKQLDGKEPPKDLKSRGLCLVPTSCIDHIDTTNMTNNGAEFWTPALGGGF